MTWGLIGGAAVTVIGGALLGGSKSGSGQPTTQQTQVYDPYAPYRNAAALKLNDLMNNPDEIQQLPEYQADMQAASRTMAAQGYTGSGNALVAAANAGGQAYQQAFNNLAMLSGAGQSPAYAAGLAANQNDYAQQMQNQMWGQIGNTVGGLINHFTGSPGGSSDLPPGYFGSGSYSGPTAIGYNSYSF